MISEASVNGLNSEEVKRRIELGHSNVDDSAKTKDVSEIVRENLFTLFNVINLILAALLIYAGSYKNLLFMVIVSINFFIGVFQEIRAKRAVDKLSLLTKQKVSVLRDGKLSKVPVKDIVLDDVVCYFSGNQVAADGEIIDGDCEVNESFLTGEPDSVHKKKGDTVLSGSFLVSGKCRVLVKKVGKDNYCSKILKSIKNIKTNESEIMRTTKKIIKFISFAIIPVSILLFYKQFSLHNFSIKNLILSVSAAILGMIPEGLILLISTVLSISVVRLAKYRVLVQDIYCIETLARVDTICFDKTGTLTEGELEVAGIVPFDKKNTQDFIDKIKMFTQGLCDEGRTFEALTSKFNTERKKIHVDNKVHFSSERKFSGVYFSNEGSYVIGAPEFVIKKNFESIQQKLQKYTNDYRVLVFAYSESDFGANKELPDMLQPLGLILIKDKIRYGTKKVIDFFNEQGVNIKIISGDNAFTVANIAKSLNVVGCDNYINLSELKDKQELINVAQRYTIFGRATPEQKQILINSLKKKEHTTAMVGDGVNDVLALKEADCSISFTNGSDAARNVSHLVLLDSNFNSVPKVVAEGRRSINNIQRSATLFLNKTIYSVLLAVLFVFIAAPYPFIPIQMTLISGLTIGIPSFFLALEPNCEKIKGNLFRNILKFSLPGALVTVFDVIVCALMFIFFDQLDQAAYSTMALFLVSYISFLVLYKISLPLSSTRKFLIYLLVFVFLCAVIFFKKFFAISSLKLTQYLLIITIAYFSFILYEKVPRILVSIVKKFKRRFNENAF